MNYPEIKTLKFQVEHCLKHEPETRNSDIILTIRLWKIFYLHYLAYDPFTVGDFGPDKVEAVYLTALFKLPSQDAIKRVRAYWQNTRKMYPPSDWRVAKKRNMLENDWRVAMGYPTKESTGTGQPSWDI